MSPSVSGSINQLCDLFQAHADIYYRSPSGHPTRSALNVRDALREFRSVAGHLPISELSPRLLRQVQAAMIESGRLSRRTINDRIAWIKRMVIWAAQQELVPETLPARMKLVEALKRGRSPAKDRPPVKPVSWEVVSSTIAHASLKIATMIEVQWWTGMRPGEVCQMSLDTIDQQVNPWIFAPAQHKTEHLGKPRIIPIGPMAQSVLTPWIARIKHAGRRWLFWGNVGGFPHDKPMLPNSYYHAISKINERHGIPHWHPNQIRHATATRLRKEIGLEAARVILGHSSATTTEIYAEIDMERAINAMKQVG